MSGVKEAKRPWKKSHKYWRTERRMKQKEKNPQQIDTQHCAATVSIWNCCSFCCLWRWIHFWDSESAFFFCFISQWMSWSFAVCLSEKYKQNLEYEIRYMMRWFLVIFEQQRALHMVDCGKSKGNECNERVKCFSFAIAIAPLWLKVESLYNHLIGVDTHMDGNRTDVLISDRFTMTFFVLLLYCFPSTSLSLFWLFN